jgi:hypothetical protein
LFPSEKGLIAPLLLLSGCHVFQTIAFDCTSDMPCATGGHGGGDADTDTDADTDADTDTTADTGPLVMPSRGYVVAIDGPSPRVEIYTAEDTLTAQWRGFDTVGPVAYDPGTEQGIVVGGTSLWWLGADGSTQEADAGDPVVGVQASGGKVYAATATNVYEADWGGSASNAAFDTDNSLVSVGLADASSVFFVALSDDGADLWRWTPGDSPTTAAAHFDVTASRSIGVFAGPDGDPYVCSRAGAIYAVGALQRGDVPPTAYYSGQLTDVTACGYDAGDGTWLMVASSGVYRVDDRGRGTRVYEPPSGYTIVAGNFF